MEALMKRKFTLIVLSVLLTILAVTLVACSNETEEKPFLSDNMTIDELIPVLEGTSSLSLTLKGYTMSRDENGNETIGETYTIVCNLCQSGYSRRETIIDDGTENALLTAVIYEDNYVYTLYRAAAGDEVHYDYSISKDEEGFSYKSVLNELLIGVLKEAENKIENDTIIFNSGRCEYTVGNFNKTTIEIPEKYKDYKSLPKE